MSNFALSTLLFLVFVFAAGLVPGSLSRARYEQQKRIGARRRRSAPEKPSGKA
ncbi:MAG TPA: hypothetical protein VHI74_08320 [Methyloceanibacter sp.]|jgi:hypothetical protein|nr:hypothetical protein [Methyloceanibacter sp.]